MTISKAIAASSLFIVFYLMFINVYSQNFDDIVPRSNKSVPIENFNQKKKSKQSVIDSLSAEIDSLKGRLSSEKTINLQLKASFRILSIKMKNINNDLLDYKRYSPIAGVAFCCALIGLSIYGFRSKKRTHIIKTSVSKLNQENNKITNELEDRKKEYELLLNENKILNELLSTLKIEQNIPNQAENKPDFFGQIFLSAGPRKSSRDTELGEDTAGLLIQGNRAFFWVLDGTSDSPIIELNRKEIISSRLLAQHLSVNLQKGITSGELSCQTWLINAIKATENQWQIMISELSEEEKMGVIKDLAERANMADVSTTALVGILGADGKASIARIGDSKNFCLDHEDKLIEDHLAYKPHSESYGRLYARATLDKNSIDLQLTKATDILHIQETTVDGVKTVLAFSDGIGHITENFLREHFNKFSLEDIQKRIVNIPQQTFDDKSLVMIQVR